MILLIAQKAKAYIVGAMRIVLIVPSPLSYLRAQAQVDAFRALDAAGLRDMGLTRENIDHGWLSETIIVPHKR